MDNGTQVTDIEKKVDYPKFKKGIKFTKPTTPIKEDEIPQEVENITTSVSDNNERGTVSYGLAAEISSNMKAESEAIEFYNKLLTYEGITESDRKQIEEFISDEKNHLQKLSEMLTHYDGNIPTSQD